MNDDDINRTYRSVTLTRMVLEAAYRTIIKDGSDAHEIADAYLWAAHLLHDYPDATDLNRALDKLSKEIKSH